MRLADQVLRGVNAHQWEGIPDGPVGPHDLPLPSPDHSPAIRGPLSWRTKAARQGSSTPNKP